MTGQIVRIIAGFYDVVCEGKEYRVRGSNNLRNKGQVPVVGDFVVFEDNGVIKDLLERRNSLIRPRVANIDQVVVVTSLVEPDFSVFLLMKILAMFEYRSIPPLLVFTKKDLAPFSLKEEWLTQGYKVFEIDGTIDLVDIIKKEIAGKLTVFTGQTGAGKTTLINLLTGLSQATGPISRALNRGKHTTRVVEIISVANMNLIDTPGFSTFNVDLSPIELARSWHDFGQLSTNCKFRSCIHHNEKEVDCAVKRAVSSGRIMVKRYNAYLQLLQEVKNG